MLAIDVQAKVGAMTLHAQLPADNGTTIVIGPNGAGKSTLLKCILGVIAPHAGRIILNERMLLSREDHLDVPTEERRIGYVPQSYGLFSRMTVFENVAFGITDVPRESRSDRVIELLEDLGIAHLAQRKTHLLSGGESQRVALARALAIRPHALLLDEPMAALDAGARRKVRSFLAVRLRAIGIPTIVVSHDAEDVIALGGRVAVLEDGRTSYVGSLAQLQRDPPSEFVKEFLDVDATPTPGTVGEIRAWK